MTMYERISDTGFVIGRFDPKDELPEPADAVVSKVDWDEAFRNVERATSIAGDQRTMRENRRRAREAADPSSEYRKMREARVRREQARRATRLSPTGAIAQAMPKSRAGKTALALTAAVPLAVVNRKAISALNEKRKDARANRPASLYYDDAVGKALDFSWLQSITKTDSGSGAVGITAAQLTEILKAGGTLSPDELRQQIEAQRAATASQRAARGLPPTTTITAGPGADGRRLGSGAVSAAPAPLKKAATPPAAQPPSATAPAKTAAAPAAAPKKTAAKKTAAKKTAATKVTAPSVAPAPAPPAPTPAPTPPKPHVQNTQFTRTGKVLHASGQVINNPFVRGAGRAGQAALKNPAATGAIITGIGGLGAMATRGVYRAKLAREYAKAPAKRRIPGSAKLAAGGAVAAGTLGAMEYANRRAERNRKEAAAFGKALPDHLEDIEKGRRLDLIRNGVGRLGQGIDSGSRALSDISVEATRTAANLRQARHDVSGILGGRQKKGIFAPAPRWTGKQIAATGLAAGGGIAAGRYLAGPRPNNYQQQQ